MRIHCWQRLLDSLELRHWSFPGEAWTEATSEDNGAGGFDEDSVAGDGAGGRGGQERGAKSRRLRLEPELREVAR